MSLNEGFLCLYILKKLGFGWGTPIPNWHTHSLTENRIQCYSACLKFKVWAESRNKMLLQLSGIRSIKWLDSEDLKRILLLRQRNILFHPGWQSPPGVIEGPTAKIFVQRIHLFCIRWIYFHPFVLQTVHDLSKTAIFCIGHLSS